MATQRDEFDSAGSGAQVKLAEILGRTVLFSPTEYVGLEKDAAGNVIGGGIMTTDYGRKDVIITDLVVLDADGGPEVFEDVMIFNGKPIGALKRRVGRKYLAVIGQSAEKIKGNYAIELHEPSEAQKQLARDYLAGRAVAAATDSSDDKKDDPWAV
jgi:hypothetical protein